MSAGYLIFCALVCWLLTRERTPKVDPTCGGRLVPRTPTDPAIAAKHAAEFAAQCRQLQDEADERWRTRHERERLAKIRAFMRYWPKDIPLPESLT